MRKVCTLLLAIVGTGAIVLASEGSTVPVPQPEIASDALSLRVRELQLEIERSKRASVEAELEVAKAQIKLIAAKELEQNTLTKSGAELAKHLAEAKCEGCEPVELMKDGLKAIGLIRHEKPEDKKPAQTPTAQPAK